MVRKCVSLTLLMALCLVVTGQTQAAEISWAEPIPMDVPLLTGDVLEAINLGGPAVADVGGVDFAAGDGAATAPLHSNFFDFLTSSWGGPTGAGDLVPDPALGTVVTTGRWIGSGATQELALTNLTPGTTYRIQLYTGDQRSCCSARGYHFEDDTGNASPVWTRGGLMALIGEFTADSDTQMMWMYIEAGSSDPHITGYVLSLATPPTVAKNPNPADNTSDIPRDAGLSWDASDFAVAHNVYLSTVAADLAQVGDNLTATILDVGILDFDTTYYWRVDEVNGAPDRTVFTGDVWSFTVEPKAIPIEMITATASSANPDMGPEKTIDGSGLSDMDEHSTSPTDMWLTLTPGSWIQYEFDKAYKLNEMLIWNSNQVIEAFIGFGVKEATIETSLDGENWTAVDGIGELAKAPGAPTYVANSAVAMGGIVAKYVKLSVISAQGLTGQSGLSEVRFLAIPVAAREPLPADSATTETATVDLGWRSGREAVSHEVYLGTDSENLALIDTTTDPATVTDPLDYETTYFWSVSEVNDAAVPATHVGNVWSFTTPEYATVDDFESYSAKEGEEVYMAWFDGFGGDASLGGSTTGHIDAPFVETTIVNGGDQSMPIFIDNDGGFANIDGNVSAPTFSEVMREFDTPQDWTASGLKTLSLMFHGAVGNAGTLYVKINNTKVMYQGNAINIARPAWQVWNIDLATTGASLNNVKTMTIGVDDGSAAGLLYIDDIRLYPVLFDVTATDITTPGDTVQGLPNDDDWPTAESPDLAVDGDASTKYLHRKGGSMATGFQVTPMVGSTILTKLTLTTANDSPNRDPITFELSGSNAGIDGPYELIASGDVVDFAGAADWPRFTQNETAIEFSNNAAYTHYQIVFPTLRGANEALMQIAEVELIGTIQ